jgi:transcriptional regulator GlxA family with amidase domain
VHFINQESREYRPDHHAIVDRICDLMLIETLREHVESLPQNSLGWLAALRDPQLSCLLSALHQQPEQNWRLDSMAEVAGLSRSTLAERFSRVMGQPAMDYLTQHRLSLTAWYLRSSSLSMARIAERVGYASESALSQAFRRELGISPRDYRKNPAAQP